MNAKTLRTPIATRAAALAAAGFALALACGPAGAADDDAGRSSLARMPAEELPEIPAEALERMRYLIGSWNVRTEFLDPAGKVVATSEYPTETRWLIQDRVALLTHDVPGRLLSKAMVFWSVDDGKFELVDVNQKGELWFLAGDLDEYVIESAPKTMPDGREIVVKFTHANIRPETFEALMDFSYDGGATWTRGQHQYASRVRPEASTDAPEWFARHMAHLTAGSGRWIADNAPFKGENEPYDAYGTEWQYGLGKRSLTGRLFAVRDGEELGDVWQFRMFWDSGRREVRLMQFGSDGTFGDGPVTPVSDDQTRSLQEFCAPDGTRRILGHETTEKPGEHVTRSFDVSADGTRTPRRVYTWKLEP